MMKHIKLVSIILLLVSFGCSKDIRTGLPLEVRKDQIDFVKSLRSQGYTPFGLNHILTHSDFTLDESIRKRVWKTKFDEAILLGVEWSRGPGISWDRLEKGLLDQENQAIEMASNYGIKSLPIIFPIPPSDLFNNQMEQEYYKVVEGKLSSEEWTAWCWVNFAEPEWYDRLGTSVGLWCKNKGVEYIELWNEPNGLRYCTPSLYSKMLRSIKNHLSKGTQLVFGGLGDQKDNKVSPIDFLTSVEENDPTCYDVLSIHYYSDPRRLATLLGLTQKEIWFTEVGWKRSKNGLFVKSDLKTQAKILRSAYINLLMESPRVKKIFWYAFCDYNSPEFNLIEFVNNDPSAGLEEINPTFSSYRALQDETNPSVR